MRAAVYARVSTFDQEPENQLAELRRYVEARGWTAFREYTDHGVSGTRERRPALDTLLKDAKRRRFDVVVCWRLDQFGRNLRHLVTVLEDLRTLGVDFISLNEGIDCTTPAGKTAAPHHGGPGRIRSRPTARADAGRAPSRAGAGEATRPATGARHRRRSGPRCPPPDSHRGQVSRDGSRDAAQSA